MALMHNYSRHYPRMRGLGVAALVSMILNSETVIFEISFPFRDASGTDIFLAKNCL